MAKIINTALDGLPFGNDTAESVNAKEKLKLPDGVTKRELMRDAVIIAWPSLIELILSSLTGMADQIMVGNMAGDAGVIGLSAVSLSVQPKFLLMTMIQALNVGATAVIARYRGQKNQERANQVLKQVFILNLIVGAAMMAIGLAFANPLIEFMSGKKIGSETKYLAAEYLKIQMYGFIPFGLMFSITAALRGIGDSKTPMIYNTIANVVNIIFNYFLIYGKCGFPEMGVVGASIATVVGQMVAFVIAAYTMLSGKRYIYISFKEKFTFEKQLMKEVIAVGIPSMIEQMFMRVGMFVFTRLVSGLGEVTYAAHTVCMSIQSLSFMLGQAFANATTTLMGQSLGKSRFDMARLYMRESRIIGIACSVGIGILMWIFNRELVWIYNKNEGVISAGAQIVMMMAFMQPIQADQFIVSGGLRGAGDTKFNAIATAITVFGVRTGLVIILVGIFDFGLLGAWIAILADTVVRTILIDVRYNTGKWAHFGLKAAQMRSQE